MFIVCHLVFLVKNQRVVQPFAKDILSESAESVT